MPMLLVPGVSRANVMLENELAAGRSAPRQFDRRLFVAVRHHQVANLPRGTVSVHASGSVAHRGLAHFG